MSIIGEKQDKGAQNQAAQETQQARSGEAIAELLIKLVQGQAASLKMHLRDLCELTTAGRIGFRVAIAKHLKELNAHVKAKKDTPEYETFRRAKNSAAARLSETVSFTKGIDAGYSPNWNDSYHALIATARTFLDSSSTGKRGAKTVPVLDKIRKYLDKLHLPAKVLKEVESMVHDMTVVTAATFKPVATPKIKAIKVPQETKGTLAQERAAHDKARVAAALSGPAALKRAMGDALI